MPTLIARTRGGRSSTELTLPGKTDARRENMGTPSPPSYEGGAASAGLAALNGGSAPTAAAGKGRRASFAALAKPSGAPQHALQEHATLPQQHPGFWPGGGMGQGAFPLIGAAAQAEQSMVMAIAETMKQGARNVEQASKSG